MAEDRLSKSLDDLIKENASKGSKAAPRGKAGP